MNVSVVVPNWNGEDYLKSCIDSLLGQTIKLTIIVVENGSVDRSREILRGYPQVVTLEQPQNLGFAGGVNVGIRHALAQNSSFILLFNNDATADKNWAKHLVQTAVQDDSIGMVTPKFMKMDKTHIDSTGDFYTIYGLPFPRGRDEKDSGQYDHHTTVFGVSGGASLYRSAMLKDVGLFDEDFFAYFEDVDLSFRAQLKGWKAVFQPKALAYHHISGTSSKLGHFSIYQTAKNFPMLYLKNMPGTLFFKYLPRAIYWYTRMFGARIVRGGGSAYLRGMLSFMRLFPNKLHERRIIQRNKTVKAQYIDSILFHAKVPILKEPAPRG